MTTVWPELPYAAWRDTQATLQLWTQVVGKVRVTLTPWLNHSWHATLYVTSRGLTTSPIPHGNRTFEIEFDFLAQQLVISVSDGGTRKIPLRPRTVADFYAEVMTALQLLNVPVTIKELPAEIPNAIRFSEDRQHDAYDSEYAQRFWKALVQIDRVFKHFRTGFIGKASPVHFFWGSFDLAVTRFSGRKAPRFTGKAPGLDAAVMQEAYSHEVSSAGFWPGGGGIDYAAFYSYAYPTPAQFKSHPVKVGAFNDSLGEFILPYDEVRTAADPDAMLLAFLQDTYSAAAATAGWNRNELECALGEPTAVRT
ncbi:MAG: hypothetical protein JSR66_21975 [Proteobacteria bacterium]|nr:hypothetical protein [Pseudomonadota bacterium]